MSLTIVHTLNIFSPAGDGYRSLRQQYRIGYITVGKVIRDTCSALYKVLQPEYLVVSIQTT